MKSLLILLTGLLLSFIIIYMCITQKQTPIAPVEKVLPTTPIPLPAKKISIASKLTYNHDKKVLYGVFPPSEKKEVLKEVEKLCKITPCNKEISFNATDVNNTWKASSLSLINFLDTNNIKGSSLSATKNDLNITATFHNEAKYLEVKNILDSLNNTNLQIKNNTSYIPAVIPQKAEKEVQENINNILNNAPIYFKFNSNKLQEKSKLTLDEIIEALNTLNTNFSITIDGHTDSLGKKQLNKKLSKKRADSVNDYLQINGLDPHIKVKTRGFGSERPKVANPKDPKNRRVEIKIIKETHE